MYYENFLNSLQPSNIIPESASFTDMAIFANRGIQDAYNETAISLAYGEMAVFESVVLNEAEDDVKIKKSVLDKVKEFFANIWKKIKEFFMKIIDKIKAFFDKKKLEAMNKLMAKFNAAVKVYKSAGSKAANDDFGYFADPVTAKDYLDIAEVIPSTAENLTRSVLDKLVSMSKETKDSTAGEDFVNEYLKDTVEKMMEEIKGDQSLKKAIKSESDEEIEQVRILGSNIGQKASALEELVRNVKAWMNSTKKCYNSSKKAIDGMMNQAKKLTNINHRTVRAFCSACRKTTSALTRIVGAINRVYKKYYSDGLRCVKKVIAGAKKWQSSNESVDFSITADTIEESFNFYLEGEDEDTKKSDDTEEVDVDFEMD